MKLRCLPMLKVLNHTVPEILKQIFVLPTWWHHQEGTAKLFCCIGPSGYNNRVCQITFQTWVIEIRFYCCSYCSQRQRSNNNKNNTHTTTKTKGTHTTTTKHAFRNKEILVLPNCIFTARTKLASYAKMTTRTKFWLAPAAKLKGSKPFKNEIFQV